MGDVSDGVKLNWQRSDFENRLGFRGGKYTDVNNGLALAIAVLLSLAYYAVLIFFVRDSLLAQMFLDRPSRIVPLFIAFLSFWSLAILFIKSRKLALQRRALDIEVAPEVSDFVLARGTVQNVLRQVQSSTDNPSHFVLFSRIERALSNLENIGRTSDMVAMLESQARNDEDHMESSYTILRGFVWAIPVLGFIGTVLGLSASIGGFGHVLAKTSDSSQLSEHLKDVTAGLSTAFETTLQGLAAALIIQLLTTGLRKSEERFLDDCREYCHRNIISRLRTVDVNVTCDEELSGQV
ncbi:MAG: biopolymer transport protein ExbB/TolQ [Candidatus Azotimanducaceae bacterium]|jgi:biopolymer transport protein ExbB/TolQ